MADLASGLAVPVDIPGVEGAPEGTLVLPVQGGFVLRPRAEESEVRAIELTPAGVSIDGQVVSESEAREVLGGEVEPALAEVAFLFGPVEYFAMMVLGLTAATLLAHGSFIKGVAMVITGLILGLVGAEQVRHEPGTTPARDQAEHDLGQAEGGGGVLHGAVGAVQRDLETAAEGEPVDEPERPLGAVAELAEHAVPDLGDHLGVVAAAERVERVAPTDATVLGHDGGLGMRGPPVVPGRDLDDDPLQLEFLERAAFRALARACPGHVQATSRPSTARMRRWSATYTLPAESTSSRWVVVAFWIADSVLPHAFGPSIRTAPMALSLSTSSPSTTRVRYTPTVMAGAPVSPVGAGRIALQEP